MDNSRFIHFAPSSVTYVNGENNSNVNEAEVIVSVGPGCEIEKAATKPRKPRKKSCIKRKLKPKTKASTVAPRRKNGCAKPSRKVPLKRKPLACPKCGLDVSTYMSVRWVRQSILSPDAFTKQPNRYVQTWIPKSKRQQDKKPTKKPYAKPAKKQATKESKKKGKE